MAKSVVVVEIVFRFKEVVLDVISLESLSSIKLLSVFLFCKCCSAVCFLDASNRIRSPLFRQCLGKKSWATGKITEAER